MNKHEKLAYAYMLDGEKLVLQELEKVYQKALKEINAKLRTMQGDELMSSRVYRKQYQEALKGQIEAILEKLHTEEYETIEEYLKESYTDGLVSTMYSLHKQGLPLTMPIDQSQVVKALVTHSAIKEGLYKSLGTDVKKLRKTISSEISRGIAQSKPYSEIARNIANQSGIPLHRAKTIVVTESHRIQEEASQDARESAKKQGCRIVKQWDATMDSRTRRSHAQLDGQIRDVDKPFEINGRKAMYPGGFGIAEEDCNCRCVALTRAEWALGEQELQTMKERAEFFKLDKTKNFEEFKKKYMDAVKE